MLHVSVTDTGAGADSEEFSRRRQDGVGVSNVERRLARHYGDAATMTIRTAPGAGTCVELWLPLAIQTEAVGVGKRHPGSPTSASRIAPAGDTLSSLVP
jgi:LytS/YehU family sensor histidine kinase